MKCGIITFFFENSRKSSNFAVRKRQQGEFKLAYTIRRSRVWQRKFINVET